MAATTAADNPRWGTADFALCFALAAGAALLIWRADGGLEYEWNWRAAFSYIASMDEGGSWRGGLLLDGLAASLRLLILGGALSLILGGALAALRMSPLGLLAACYVESLRNLPPIVFMFVFFYFVGGHIFAALGVGELLANNDSRWLTALVGEGHLAENFIVGVVCLALFESAFFSEVIRAGVLSVERGQWDAARALGFGRMQTLRLIILPQALKNTAAPLVGQLILLIKDSAILSVISVPELTFAAQEASASSRRIFEIWLLAAAFYFALCWPLLKLAERLERPRPGNTLPPI